MPRTVNCVSDVAELHSDYAAIQRSKSTLILGNQVADLEIFRAKQDSFLARRQQQQETLKFRQEEQTRRLENIEKKDQIDRDRWAS